MLRQDDLRIDVGRCVGGSFVQVTHLPTGLTRKKGPLEGEPAYSVEKRFLNEIEQELITKGLTQYIIADYRKRYGEP